MEWICLRKGAQLRRVVLPLVGAILGSPAISLACPLCKDALTGDPVAAAFNGTTLFMIAAPSVLVSAVGGWIIYAYWQHARRVDAAAAAPEVAPTPTEWWPAPTEKESQT